MSYNNKKQLGNAWLGLPKPGHNNIYSHALSLLSENHIRFYKSKVGHNLLNGLNYPDVPCPSFIKSGSKVLISPSSCINMKNFYSFIKDFNPQKTFNFIREMTIKDRDSIITESHFGRKSYWHSMSPLEGKTLQEVAEGIVGRIGIIYQQALELYQTDKLLSIFHLGRLLHTIQESYSPGHVVRNIKPGSYPSKTSQEIKTRMIMIDNKVSRLSSVETKKPLSFILRYLKLKYSDYNQLWKIYENPTRLLNNTDFVNIRNKVFPNFKTPKEESIKQAILRLIYDEQEKKNFKDLYYKFNWNNITGQKLWITNFFTYENIDHGKCDNLNMYKKNKFYNCSVYHTKHILNRFYEDINTPYNKLKITSLMDWLINNVFTIHNSDLNNLVHNGNQSCTVLNNNMVELCPETSDEWKNKWIETKRHLGLNKERSFKHKYKKYKSKYLNLIKKK